MSAGDFYSNGPPLRRTGLHLAGLISTKRPEPDGNASPIDRSR